VNKQEKATEIENLHERLRGASLAITTHYRGLTVLQMSKLRRELRAVDARYDVAKNTLTRRAIKETSFEKLDALLRGPTGLVTTGGDPVAVAKILVKYAEHHDKLKITGAVLDGAPLEAKAVADLAKLPSREVLLAQLLGLINAPASQLLRTIQEPGAQLVRLLGALQREKEKDAPIAEATPAAEAEPSAEAVPAEAAPATDGGGETPAE
jgi:large subunit ribosomal protein L10